MGREDVELVAQLQAPLLEEADVKAALGDVAALDRMREVLDPDAEIRFVGPDGGTIGMMSGPYRGPEGLLAGWREWLEPWERFRIELEQTLDAGDGRVLSLVELRGRMKGGAEVSQPAASVIHVRDGIVVEAEFHLNQALARRAAGFG
jgi:ketosteroid isomerase-like protein